MSIEDYAERIIRALFPLAPGVDSDAPYRDTIRPAEPNPGKPISEIMLDERR